MIQQFQFWVYTLKIEIRISKTYLTVLFTIAKIPVMQRGFTGASASFCCYNKSTQTQRLKAVQIYSLVLRVKSLK